MSSLRNGLMLVLFSTVSSSPVFAQEKGPSPQPVVASVKAAGLCTEGALYATVKDVATLVPFVSLFPTLASSYDIHDHMRARGEHDEYFDSFGSAFNQAMSVTLGGIGGPVYETVFDGLSYGGAKMGEGLDYLAHGAITEDHPHAEAYKATRRLWSFMGKQYSLFVGSDESACQKSIASAKFEIKNSLDHLGEKQFPALAAHADSKFKVEDTQLAPAPALMNDMGVRTRVLE